MGYDQAKASIKSSFAQTGLDYIDLQASPYPPIERPNSIDQKAPEQSN